MTITWVPPDDSGGVDITAYVILVDGAPFLSPTRQYKASGLAPGAPHTFSVAARNRLHDCTGDGPTSPNATFVTRALSAPDVPTLSQPLTAGGGAISLAWAPGSTNGGGLFASFVVRVVGGPGGALLRTVPGSVASVTVYLPGGWTRARARVCAFDDRGARMARRCLCEQDVFRVRQRHE